MSNRASVWSHWRSRTAHIDPRIGSTSLVSPSNAPGAAVVEKTKRDRTRSGKGIVVTVGGPVPPLDGEPREISNLQSDGHASRPSKNSPTQHNWYR
ncbi:hypothetical protein M2251_000147 [Rhodococcus erythropolis]|nr:hypothetical protein [Rhodococcus erythropolis]